MRLIEMKFHLPRGYISKELRNLDKTKSIEWVPKKN